MSAEIAAREFRWRISVLTGPLLSIHNVTGKGLQGATSIDGAKVLDLVPVAETAYQLR
ncbi:MAG: hypothetical protein WDO12_14255 [Pseudomonadota bacterium]